MKYMLLIYGNQSDIPDVTPEQQKVAFQEWMNYEREAKAAGILLMYNGLLSVDAATTVRIRGDETFITDGPFAETHETLGGFYLIDVPNLDEALQWAKKVPSAKYGSIEVRPLWSPGA